MKVKLCLLLLLSFLALPSVAQKSSVYSFFEKGISELVSESKDVKSGDDEEKTNHVYSRLFVAPVLYSSVLNKACADNVDDDVSDISDSKLISMDEKRTAVIDKLLLDMYCTSPERIEMTEEDLDKEIVHSDIALSEESGSLKKADTKMYIPDNLQGGMKTTVVKPNYWSTKGRVELKFTQNYVSGNWFQGGESNKTMFGQFDFDLNYDDKDRITFKTHFDVDLGFATTKADTLHSFKTNTDRLRIESTLGYKMVKNLDVTVKVKLESQSLPNYPTNNPDFVSNFMAPFDANFSIGINYKPTWKEFRVEIFCAPLSAYNYRFVRYGDLTSRYGIRKGRHHKEDFGTQFIVTVPRQKIMKLVDWYSRAELYTNYARTFFQWENSFDVSLNRYLTASLSLHARFDDSARHLYDDEYGYWQIKEFMTLGVIYSW